MHINLEKKSCITFGITGGQGLPKNQLFKDKFLLTVNFFLTSVQVIIVAYCCLFCVLLNNVLNVSIGTKIHAPTSWSQKKSAPQV